MTVVDTVTPPAAATITPTMAAPAPPAPPAPAPAPVVPVDDDGADDLDAAYAEIRREPYRFTWAERKWELPHLGGLDYRLQAEIENGRSMNVEQLESLFERIFGPEQWAIWESVTVPTPVLFMLFERWIKHAGAKPGEAPAPGRSAKSTGAKSKRTSAGSTGSASPRRSTAKKAAGRAVSPRGKSST